MGLLAKNKELFLSTSGDVVRGWERDYGRLVNISKYNNYFMSWASDVSDQVREIQ